jgi:hypothetical protein
LRINRNRRRIPDVSTKFAQFIAVCSGVKTEL